MSPEDRDLIIKTVIGEADDQPDRGKAAVAHAILNRVADGRWGETPSKVVLARGQFEPWSTRAAALNKIDPQSRKYQRTGAIVDDVIRGKIPDETGGATHFLDPVMARKRRGGSLPDWASGDGVAIGDHTFYRPEEGRPTKVAANDDALIDRYFGPAEAKPAAAPEASPAASGDDAALIDRYFGAPGDKGAPAAAPAPPPDALPTPPQVGTGRTWQTPAEAAAAEKSTKEYLAEHAVGADRRIVEPEKIPATFMEHVKGGVDLAKSGWKDIREGKYLPSVSTDQTSKRTVTPLFGAPYEEPGINFEGGGLAKVAGGILGTAGSLFSAPAQELINRPLTELTGNPEFGSRVEAVAPGLAGGKLAAKAAPAARATNEIVKAIPKEDLPEVVSRLESNPRLTLMDVSTGVRTRAQGLAATPGPAQGHLDKFVKERAGGSREAVGDAYDAMAGGPPPKALEGLDEIEQRARDIGRKEIQPALKKAGPVDVSPVIAAIDKEVNPGMEEFAKTALPLSKRQQELRRLRQQLITENGEMRIDPQRLHEIQSANGTNAYQFSKSLDAEQKQAGAGLRDINEKLVDAIDKASGGAYRPARAKFAEAKDVHEAFDRGLNIGRARTGSAGVKEDSPEAWARWAKDAKPDEIDAAKLGALSEMHMGIGRAYNAARKGMDIPESEFMQAKLGTLFGKTKADRMVQVLRDERDMARTHGKLFEGAKTAETLLGAKAMAVREVKPIQHQGMTGMLPFALGTAFHSTEAGGLAALGALGARAGLKGWQKVGQMSDIARNKAFARAASATGAERDAVISLLRSRMDPVGKRNKLANFLSSPIAQIAPR